MLAKAGEEVVVVVQSDIEGEAGSRVINKVSEPKMPRREVV